MTLRALFRSLTLSLAVAAIAAGSPPPVAAESSPLVLVLDASGSMWGQEVAHNFLSGDLVVGAVRGAELVDATVAVKSDGESVGAGRTYKSASSNPKRFSLAPGNYEVALTEIRGETRRFTVSIAAGEEVSRTIDFARPQP